MGILSTVYTSQTLGGLMATSLISGRVSEECKERAAFYIRRAGLTASDVIRIVWENIAATGEVPQPVQKRPMTEEELLAEADKSETMRRFYALRNATPRSEFLENLTPEGLKEELANRDI